MNPLTKVKLINELNEREADLGIKEAVSWHSVYKDSAWIFIGGFPYELTEGDIICVFSQYGEIANINLVRDKKTGKSKGFCFLCYEDQRSTILAVDNFNGIKIKGRTIRVDHVKNYRPPKDTDDIDDITKQLREEGCAPKVPLPPSSESESEEEHAVPVKKPKKDKKEKKKKKKEKKEKKKALKEERHESRTETSSPPRVKKEREDSAYEKYVVRGPTEHKRDRPGQDRSTEVERFRERQGDDRRSERERQTGERDWDRQMSERDWDRQTDRNREGKRHEDTQQRDNRERGRGSDRERERYGDREKERDRERERDRDRDRGFAKQRS